MSTTRERFQNPTCSDLINLRLLVYNSNELRDVGAIQKVEIYFLDPTEITQDNPDGRRLVQTIDGSQVAQEYTGKYLLPLQLSKPMYTIGKYHDVWYLDFEGDGCIDATENSFRLYPDLWFTTPIPLIYDFTFGFMPNRIVKGSKRFLNIEITPNVPRAADLIRYYANLIISADLQIFIQQSCGDCLPDEQDLRMVVDGDLVTNREKNMAYYYLDTTEMECGIYDVSFQLALGDNLYVSEKSQLQIHD